MDGAENIWTTEAMTSSVNDNNEIVGYIEEVLSTSFAQDVTDIMPKIERRLEIGIERYGHGIIALDDTTQYGSESNDWLDMMEEECIDALVYCASKRAQMKRMETPFSENQMARLWMAMESITVALKIADSLRRETAP